MQFLGKTQKEYSSDVLKVLVQEKTKSGFITLSVECNLFCYYHTYVGVYFLVPLGSLL